MKCLGGNSEVEKTEGKEGRREMIENVQKDSIVGLGVEIIVKVNCQKWVVLANKRYNESLVKEEYQGKE
jgi:hypothetical protein